MPTQSQLWERLSGRKRLFIIAGPCVIETEAMCIDVAGFLKQTCQKLGIFYVFKASFDKANRTSATSFRGPGLEAGLQ
ncbi:MAG: 3-deoxy-8-phosphooctulonate synthase, partial [Verrucomicrobiae bacterium]|nr:3-deoxy-8-phosphooctulonate synthase [Verrucomicrobiae bacterium]